MPRAWGSSSSIPAASIRRSPGTPLALPAALELVEPVELGGVGGDDHLAAALAGDAALRRSTRTARARPPRTGAPSASRARSRRRRGSRRSCGRSGACRSRARARARTPTRAGCARSARARPPGRRSRRRRSPGRSCSGALRIAVGRRSTPRQAISCRRAPGPPGRGRRGGVDEAGAVEAFVAAAAELASRWPCSRAVICAGVGCAPSTPLAMISAAVAATWGVAIEVPS